MYSNKNVLKISILFFLFSCFYLNAQRADRFDGKTPSGKYDVITSDDFDDKSKQLQRVIDNYGKEGGKIKIKGKLTLGGININKSNIHIDIEKGTIIKLSDKSNASTVFLVNVSKGARSTIENVKISCSNCSNNFADNTNEKERYVVDYTFKSAFQTSKKGHEAANLARFGNVRNFMISHFLVKDNFTRINAITTNPVIEVVSTDPSCGNDCESYQKKFKVLGAPSKGDVKYGHIINGHSGYGLVQTQGGQNINFHYLSGVGGVTLRLESGAGIASVPTDQDPVGDLDDIEAYEIYCENGYATIMTGPHNRSQGTITLQNIKAKSCSANIFMEPGFRDRDLRNMPDNLYGCKSCRYRHGTFKSIKLKGVIQHVFGNNAQAEHKMFGFYPQHLVSDTIVVQKDGTKQTKKKSFSEHFSNHKYEAPFYSRVDSKIGTPSVGNIICKTRKSAEAPLDALKGEYPIDFTDPSLEIKSIGFDPCTKDIVYKNDWDTVHCMD